jgi:hypothetical protein
VEAESATPYGKAELDRILLLPANGGEGADGEGETEYEVREGLCPRSGRTLGWLPGYSPSTHTGGWGATTDEYLKVFARSESYLRLDDWRSTML